MSDLDGVGRDSVLPSSSSSLLSGSAVMALRTPPGYLSHTIGVEYYVAFFASVVAFFLFTKIFVDHIARRRPTIIEYTPAIGLYTFVAILVTLLSSIHLGYMAIMWRLKENIYDARILFWTGFIQQMTQVVLSFTLCVQIVDQVLDTTIKKRYGKRIQKIIAFVGFIAVIVGSIPIGIKASRNQIPKTSVTKCRTTGCQLYHNSGQLLLDTRYSMAFVNTIAGIVYFVVLKLFIVRIKEFRRKEIHRHRKAKAQMISCAIIFDSLFTFVPHLTAFCLYMFSDINASEYAGPYSQFFVSTQLFLTAIVYYRKFKGIKWRSKAQDKEQWAFSLQRPKTTVNNAAGPKSNNVWDRGAMVDLP